MSNVVRKWRPTGDRSHLEGAKYRHFYFKKKTMRNTRSKYRAKEGLTFVLEPFLHPVACGVAKREFVEHIGKDLSAQRVLDVKHRFPVAKV